MTKELQQLYKKYPTQEDCVNHLEEIIWNSKPVCPYCNISYYSPLKNENRYHCNNCNSSFSVTTKTFMHKTRVDLQKWISIIRLLLSTNNTPTVRELAQQMEVTKDTSHRMLNQTKRAILTGTKWIYKI